MAVEEAVDDAVVAEHLAVDEVDGQSLVADLRALSVHGEADQIAALDRERAHKEEGLAPVGLDVHHG